MERRPRLPNPTFTDEAGHSGEGQAKESGTILGLRKRNFWIITVIILIIVGATVGGSIGGALHIRNANTGTINELGATIESTPPSNFASPSATPTVYVPLPAASVSEIDISCPTSLLSYNRKYYECFTESNIWGSDITAITAYSLQQCIDACSTMNELARETKCKGVALSRDLSKNYMMSHGANCWLKNDTDQKTTYLRVTLAVLK